MTAQGRHKAHGGAAPVADPEAGAWVKVVPMIQVHAASERQDAGPPLRLKPAQSAFPWRVLVPVSVSPRLRGLVLLNLVRGGPLRAGRQRAAAPAAPRRQP